MLTLRKHISRRPWLLAVLAFMLLALNQQAAACNLMKLSSDQTGQHCPQHDDGMQQMETVKKPCCDFPSAYTAAGSCHNDQSTTINTFLPGKFNPDYHPVLMSAVLQEVHLYPPLSPLPLASDREPSRPGIQTYLLTQRLRI